MAMSSQEKPKGLKESPSSISVVTPRLERDPMRPAVSAR